MIRKFFGNLFENIAVLFLAASFVCRFGFEDSFTASKEMVELVHMFKEATDD